MTIFYSITIAAIRLVLLIILLYVIRRKIYKRKEEISYFDGFISFSVVLGAILLLLGFFLAHFGLLDLIVILSLIGLYFIIELLDFSSREHFIKRLNHLRMTIVYWVIKNFEIKKTVNKKTIFSKIEIKKYFSVELLTALTISVFVFLFRYHYSGEDDFVFSEIWYTNLDTLNDLHYQNFSSFSNLIVGEQLLIKVYSLITGLSSYLALYSFGLVQTSILAVIIFWFIQYNTRGNIFLAVFGSIAFVTFYAFLPINTFNFFEHKPIYTSTIFILPTLVFYKNPELLSTNKKKYFIGLTSLFLAVLLTDIFMSIFVLLPLFSLLLASSPFLKAQHKATVLLALSISVFTVFLGLYFFSIYRGLDFGEVLNSLLFSFQSYTYSPFLYLPYQKLKDIYISISIIGIIFCSVLYFKNKKEYFFHFSILAYGILILCIPPYFPDIVDSDLMNEFYVIYIPILLSMSIFMVTEVFKIFISKNKSLKVFNSFFIILLGLGIYFHFKNDYYKLKNTENDVAMDALSAYHQLNELLLPYSYSIVDIGENTVMSSENHFFTSYQDFNKTYPKRDSLYAIYKDNHDYLHLHPDIVLPPQTYVFIYKEASSIHSSEDESTEIQTNVQKNLIRLKKRGRDISLFYSSPKLNVYQIKNNSKPSSIHELIFP